MSSQNHLRIVANCRELDPTMSVAPVTEASVFDLGLADFTPVDEIYLGNPDDGCEVLTHPAFLVDATGANVEELADESAQNAFDRVIDVVDSVRKIKALLDGLSERDRQYVQLRWLGDYIREPEDAGELLDLSPADSRLVESRTFGLLSTIAAGSVLNPNYNTQTYL